MFAVAANVTARREADEDGAGLDDLSGTLGPRPHFLAATR